MIKILLPDGYIHTDQNINSLDHLASLSSQAYEEINRCKNKLRMMAIAAPSTITPKGDNAIEYITEQVDDIVDTILEQAETVDSASMYTNCIEMWRHHSIEESGEKDVDVDTAEGFNKVVINDDEARSKNFKEKYPNYFDLKNLDSVLDYTKLCVDTCDNSREADDMWVVYIQGKLFIRFDGKYVFPTKEAAHDAIREYLGIRDGHNIFSKNWLSKNESFANDFLAHFKDERKERYRKYIYNIINYSNFNIEELQELWDALDELIWTKLEANGYTIRFVNIKDSKSGETYK